MKNRYICIKSSSHPVKVGEMNVIKMGDIVHMREWRNVPYLNGEIGYVFKEDLNVMYSCTMFLPIPDDKIQYVSISEKTIESLPEPVLN